MKTCAGSRPRRRCAALALLLLLVALTIGESSLQWLQGSHHQQRRQRQQQQQREEQLGQHQGKGRRRHDGEGVYSIALIFLTAEATQLPAQEQATAATSGAATAGEATAAAESEHVDGTSKSAEVHAEQQQREASAGEQEQGHQRGASSQQPQEAGQLSSSQGRGMSRDVPKSTVLPVALPPASHFESLSDAAAAPQAAARAASADATATVLPSPLPRAEPNATAVKEEAPVDSTAGPPAAGDVDPRPSARQQQPQSTERDVASSSSSAGGPAADGSSLDSASALTSPAGEARKAAPHGDLLWTLLWPAAVFPVWMLARVSWLLKVLAVVAAAVMQLAPLPTALRVRAHRSTGEVQGLPFLLLLFSASLWLAYGLLKLDLVLLLPNVTGVLLSCWYLHIFMQYCGRPSKDVSIDYSSSMDSTSPRWEDEALECMKQAARGRKQRTQIYCHAAGCLLVACGICVAAAAGLARPTHLVGLTAAVVNVLTYAAPLAALRRVLRTRSTACMPVEVSVGNWICSSLWLIYGWLSADAFILLPNLLGTIVGLLQVGLLMKFPPPSRRYLAFVDRNADDVSASSHLCASVPGVACSPCAESSYLLTAADAAAVGGAAADHSDAFSAVGTAAAGAPALLTPTAARVGGPVLADSALHEDAQSISSTCTTASPPPYHSTLPTAGVAYRQQQAWHVPQDFDNVKRTGGGNNGSSTNYGSSTCDSLSSTSIRGSRLCSPSINYGSSMCGTSSTTYGSSGYSSSSHGSSVAGRSDCSVGSGVTRAAENLLSNEGPARHISDTAHDDGYSGAYQPCARKSSSFINSSNGKSSVCGFNAPSLPTHEMLLRDWQQRLKDDEARRGLSSSTACASVAAATEGGGSFPP